MDNTVWKILVAVLTLIIVVGAIVAVVLFGQTCEHNFEETVLTPATCFGEGVMQRKCKLCGFIENDETIPAYGSHNMVFVEEKPATCTTDGFSAHNECTRCDYFDQYNIIPAHGHLDTVWKFKSRASYATCETDGKHTEYEYCNTCKSKTGNEIEIVDPALGHNMSKVVPSRTPTCMPGWDAYLECTNKDQNTNKKCTHNTKVEIPAAYAHVPATESEYIETKAATCTDPGSYYLGVFCITEGKDGNGNYKCRYEFEERRSAEMVIAPLGHDYVVQDDACTATCTTAGWTCHKVCKRSGCGAEVFENRVEALGHALIKIDAVPASCTTAGNNEYYLCSACSAVFSDAAATTETTVEEQMVAALGHVGGTPVVDESTLVQPTCANEGGYERVTYCQNPGCGIELLREYLHIPVTTHELLTHTAKAPTCTEIGWSKYEYCTKCDYATFEKIDALGHVEETPATCTTAAVCKVCHKSYGDALGHEEVPHEAKAPNCTDIGWDAYVTCNRAGCTFTTYFEKSALGHNEVVDPAKPANCLETGLTQGKHCSTCGVVIIPQNVTAALGHDMNEVTGKCNRSGCTESYSVGLAYEFNADGTLTVAGMGSCTDVNVVIPAFYDGKAVTSISASAFYYNTSIKSVVIPDSVVSIGNYAFFYCDRLTTVTIGSGVVSIGNEAFNYCPISVVNYHGSAAQWNAISFGRNNSPLTGATRRYF